MLAEWAAAMGAQPRPLELSGAVPDASAFSFLSATPKQIERPGSLRDLGVAIQNGVNANGKATAGFSLDASVWNLVPRQTLPLARYQTSRWGYYDGGDPMADSALTTSLRNAARRCLPRTPDDPPMLTCLDSVTTRVVSEWKGNRWNSTQLSASAAFGSRFAGGRLRSMAYSGMDAWLTGSTGVGSRLILLGQTSYKHRQALDTLPSYRAVTIGTRAVFGSSNVTAFLEFGREWRAVGTAAPAFQIDRQLGGWSAGLEMRIAPNTWMSRGLGTRYDALVPSDQTQLFAGLKWGMTSQSRLRTMQGQ